MVLYRDGHRYWATWIRNAQRKKVGVRFWSSHRWPFYRCSYTPKVIDKADLWRKFREFVPSDV